MNERAFPSHKKMIMMGIVLLYMLFSGCEKKADYRATCTVPIGRLLLSEEWLELGVVQMNEVQEKWIRIFNPTQKSVSLSIMENPEENTGLKVTYHKGKKHVPATQTFILPGGHVDSLLVTFSPQHDNPYGEFLYAEYLKCDGEILMTGIKVSGIVVDNFENVLPDKAPRGILNQDSITFQFDQGKQVPVAFDVEIRNDGYSNLIVRKVEVTCSCVMTELNDTIIAPGKSSTLHAKLIPEGLAGSFWQEIRLVTNDPTTPLKTVFIKCHVKEK